MGKRTKNEMPSNDEMLAELHAQELGMAAAVHSAMLGKPVVVVNIPKGGGEFLFNLAC